MAFKMKGHTLPGINQRMDKSSQKDGRAKSSAFQRANYGAFVDGERVTYDAARAAEEEGGNVTYTNKEAQKKADSMGKGEQLKKGAYKGPGGKGQKAFDKAKSDDAKAQASTEKRAKILKTSERKTGSRNAEGYKGTEIKREADAAFDKKNSKIKTEKSKKPLTGEDYQGVKGASKTINTKGAQKGTDQGGTKNTKDYDRDKKQAKMKELKDKVNKKN